MKDEQKEFMESKRQEMIYTLNKIEACISGNMSDVELKHLKDLRTQIEQVPINEIKNTSIFNEEAIGLNVDAHTVVFNGSSKGITIQKAEYVIFNNASKEVVVEYAKEVVNNA